ncbi:MAG: DUF1080 domain-containing protein [Undibacterium sp.]|nr:DUF1080 domain-containing protein [Opitutaceae bacterium]
MKTRFAFLIPALALCLAATHAAEKPTAWTSMFNGKDLTGWKSNEELPGVFTVANGELKVSGGRAHLFYGADGNASFKNFEFKAKVKTTKGSNSGIYIHTMFEAKGWPTKGYECQVNSTHTDKKKTGGLYAVKDVMDVAPSTDEVWFDYYIKVDGKHIVIQIDGKTTVDWNEPADWDPSKTLKNMDGRKLSAGTIALQGHDPKSVTYYKDLSIRALP